MVHQPAPYTPILLILYIIEFIVSTFTVMVLGKHLYNKFLIGPVSAFMLCFGAFAFFFGSLIGISILSRFIDIYQWEGRPIDDIRWLLLVFGHIGTTVTFGLVGWLVSRKRFDIYISVLSPEDLKKER